ncbi:MAG TPA: LysR family transcriptional regulator [Gaiellaceae bacterium]|nr:LysR family transcriptional regulator [Gaiellaceae bacterium]
MDVRRLRSFVAVARAGTYSAAARQLHLSQPALWKQVQALERELGVRLFERHGRRVRATWEGRQLLERCDALVRAADELSALAGELRAGRTGLVTVSCLPPHVARFLAGVLAEFRPKNPGIAVRLREPAGGDPLADLAAGAADLAVGTGRSDGRDSFVLYRVRTVVVSPPKHRLARRTQLDVSELRGEPLLLAPAGFRSRVQLEAACGAAGFEPLIVHESSSPAALLALAQAGMGLAVLSDDALPPRRAQPRSLLVRAGAALADEVRMYARPGSSRAPAVEAFLAEARLAARRERA